MRAWFEGAYSLRFENYPVGEEYLTRGATVEECRPEGTTTIGADLWGPRGKDRAFVCVVTRASVRSASGDDVLVLAISEKEPGDLNRINRRADGQIVMAPMALPGPGDDLDWVVLDFAHESGHIFGLGDEYGEPNTSEGDDFETFADADTGKVEKFPNLHAAATLVSGDQLDGTRIKWWGWLRIAAAAAFAGPPAVDPGGARATLVLREGAARSFSVGDRVRVRRRLLVRNAENNLVYQRPVQSGVLKVAGRPDGEHLVVETDGTPAADEVGLTELEATFVLNPSMIVYRPVMEAITSNPLEEAPVLSPVVRARLESTDKPLNAKPDGPHTCEIDDLAVQEPRNMPMAPLNKPCYRPLVIGLYDGGAQFHCGVYHAGGICNMRDQSNGGDKRRFCHVCRYVLVDVIDPTKHGALDKIYAREYVR